MRPRGGAYPGPTPHGKAQSAAPASRRLRFSVTLPPGRSAGRNPPPACGALWKIAQLGKCAHTTPRQAAGGLRQGPQASAVGPDRTERRSRSVHKSAKMTSRRWFGAFVYTVASELHWVTRVSQPPWDACGTDGVLLQQGTFYLLALDARRGRCRCEVSESLTSSFPSIIDLPAYT